MCTVVIFGNENNFPGTKHYIIDLDIISNYHNEPSNRPSTDLLLVTAYANPTT